MKKAPATSSAIVGPRENRVVTDCLPHIPLLTKAVIFGTLAVEAFAGLQPCWPLGTTSAPPPLRRASIQ